MTATVNCLRYDRFGYLRDLTVKIRIIIHRGGVQTGGNYCQIKASWYSRVGNVRHVPVALEASRVANRSGCERSFSR